MGWVVKGCPSWEAFVEFMTAADFGPPAAAPFAFRGQPNAASDLKPSLARIMPAGTTPARAVEIESHLLAEFRAQAHLHVAPTDLPDLRDTLAWLTLMQHHGAPTRLLDWTKSPYVAAYFAVATERAT